MNLINIDQLRMRNLIELRISYVPLIEHEQVQTIYIKKMY